LDGAAFAGLSAGILPILDFVIGTAALDASDRVIHDDAMGALMFDPGGTGAVTSVRFATLTPSLALTNADLSVV
jgi:serralysin